MTDPVSFRAQDLGTRVLLRAQGPRPKGRDAVSDSSVAVLKLGSAGGLGLSVLTGTTDCREYLCCRRLHVQGDCVKIAGRRVGVY